MVAQPDAQPQPAAEPQAQTAPRSLDGSLYTIPASQGPANPADGTDDGIVQVAPDTSAAPALNQRPAANDPDSDIVHPAPLPPGTLGEGAVIRVRLLDRLSTARPATGFAPALPLT
jgi:hypothetical protein